MQELRLSARNWLNVFVRYLLWASFLGRVAHDVNGLPEWSYKQLLCTAAFFASTWLPAMAWLQRAGLMARSGDRGGGTAGKLGAREVSAE